VPTGPLQLLVLGFNHRDVEGAILDELHRLRDNETVRVIDSLAVYKDAAGEIEVEHLSTRSDTGRVVGALVGLSVDGEDDADLGADADPLAEEGGWDVLQDIPNDTAAALVLIEHHWAVPLRDAVLRSGGFPISDGFITDERVDTFASRRIARHTIWLVGRRRR
jgi:hypothetical protein